MRSEHRHADVERIAQNDADAFAAGTQIDQFVGEPGNATKVLGIAQSLILTDESLTVWRLRRCGGEHMHDRRVDIRYLVHRFTT